MRITVFGATGTVGKYVISQALAAGHHVVAFGRNIEKMIDADLSNESLEVVKGYVFDEDNVYKAIKGSDAVISVLGGAFSGADKTRSLGIKNIIEQMERASVKRIIILGGKGILPTDDEHLVMDLPDYPEEYKPVGYEHLKAYEFLAASKLDWTVIASPDIVDADKTEAYITSIEQVPNPDLGRINAGDLAHFMLASLTRTNNVHKRVGVSAS